MAKKAAASKKKPAPKRAASSKMTSDQSSTLSSEPQLHPREATQGEVMRQVRVRSLAVNLLIQRDQMDEVTAKMVVDSMDAADVEAMAVEASAVLSKALNAAESMQKVAAHLDARAKEEAEGVYVPLASVEPLALLEDIEISAGTSGKADYVHSTASGFGNLAMQTAELSKMKNDAERKYKAFKATIYGLMKQVGVMKIQMPWGLKLRAYQGNNRSLSATKLIEKGVDPAIVEACYVDTPFDDVSFYASKGGQ